MTNDELIARAEAVSKDKVWVTVKSDLIPDLIAALKASEARVKALEGVVDHGVDLITGDKTGIEWKKACRDFAKEARAAQKGGVE